MGALHAVSWSKSFFDAKATFSVNFRHIIRESSIRELKDFAKTRAGQNSFCITTGKIWNNSPNEIKNAKNIITAKRLIKAYCKSMPI